MLIFFYQKQIRNYRGVIKSAYFEWLFSKEVASASLILLFESQTWLRIWFFSLFNEFEDMIRKHQIQQIHLNHNYESYFMINQYEDKCLTVGYFIWNFSKRQHFTPEVNFWYFLTQNIRKFSIFFLKSESKELRDKKSNPIVELSTLKSLSIHLNTLGAKVLFI